VVRVAAGQAARTAASIAPGGTVPGTQTRIVRVRPVQVYSHATCGVPYMRRRHTEGVRTPVSVVQNAAADSGGTSGGAAMVSHRAPAANRVCRQARSWSRPKTAPTIAAAAMNPSHGRGAIQCQRSPGQVGVVVMRPHRFP